MDVDTKTALILGRPFPEHGQWAGEVHLKDKGQTMFPSQDIQSEEVRERVGEAIYPINRHPQRIHRTTMDPQKGKDVYSS